MNAQALVNAAHRLVGCGQGLLAMDESIHTCNSRFAAEGIPQTEPARRAYRELLITTPHLGDCISGAILCDETIGQHTSAGVAFADCLSAAGILTGIKVDAGTVALAGHPGEKITEGLDGLRPRLARYFAMGARFAKWRAVIAIGADIPSQGCIAANAHALARYAALCQEADLVPMVEPEVLMAGDHSLQRCRDVTETVLLAVFAALEAQRVLLEAVILKPNMVLPGLDWPQQPSATEVAEATLGCLLRTTPAAVAGVAFLSGGQSGEQATARLAALNQTRRGEKTPPPWPLVFSFARALQTPALAIWHGDDANREAAQRALLHRARCNHAALHGNYSAAMEQEATLQPVA